MRSSKIRPGHVPRHAAAAASQVSRLRRAAAERSLRVFAHTYLPGPFSAGPSPMHLELFGLLEAGSTQRGLRLAVAAPRGHAKSTIVSLAYILWCICYRRESYIVLISNTGDQSADLLSFAKSELTGNDRLGQDFPEVIEPPGPSRWRKGEIITRNGVKITALGAEQKIRGRRHAQHRPGLIIVDDVENEQDVRSEDQRRARKEWFNRGVLKAGSSTTNVVVVGTILHYDSLLSTLLNPALSPGWTSRKFQAVRRWSEHPELWQRWESIYSTLEEHDGRSGRDAARTFFEANRLEMLLGTDVLWPQREDYYELMEIRLREGRASFDSEKQNEPVNPEDCLFPEEGFVYWDDQHEDAEALRVDLGKRLLVYGACDPSLGKAGRNRDDSAIVTLFKDRKSGVHYVVDADIRRRKPDQIIEDIIQYQRLRGYSGFGIESVQYQEFLAQETRKRSAQQGLPVPVHHIDHTTDKLGRIQRLQPLIASGMIRFSRRHTVLLDQLRQFPHAAHDDGPDALEMAVDAADMSWFLNIPRGRFGVP